MFFYDIFSKLVVEINIYLDGFSSQVSRTYKKYLEDHNNLRFLRCSFLLQDISLYVVSFAHPTTSFYTCLWWIYMPCTYWSIDLEMCKCGLVCVCVCVCESNCVCVRCAYPCMCVSQKVILSSFNCQTIKTSFSS